MILDFNGLVRKRCRESFYEFVKEFWHAYTPEKPDWNWHIKFVCDEMQKVAERVINNEPKKHDLLINIPPGSTKSTIGSRMFPAWVWTRMPNAVCICISHTARLANDFSVECRDIINSERYQTLFPEIVLKDDQDTKTAFKNTKKGERKAISVGGKVTGSHGHFILLDDPIDPEGVLSEAVLEKTNRWISQSLPTRVKNVEIVPFIMIMQRLHQNDPSAQMLETGEARHICLPAELSDDVKPKRLRKFYKDGLMSPNRLSQTSLLKKQKQLTSYSYTGQYQQNPIPPEGGMFQVQKLDITDYPPRRIVRKIRSWDKAGTKGGTGAYTAGVLMGIDTKDEYWVLDVVRGRWRASEREEEIQRTARLDGDSVEIVIEQEPGSGGKESAEATVKRLSGYRVRVVLPKGDKALRADPFSVQVNWHNVHILKKEWTKDYIDEMQFFPLSKYKDQIDASSQAFAELAKPAVAYGAL